MTGTVDYAEWTRRPDESTTWRFEARLTAAAPDRRNYLASLCRRRSHDVVGDAVPDVDLDPRPIGAVNRTVTVAVRDGLLRVSVADVFQRRFDTLGAAVAWGDEVVAAGQVTP